jgi:hypothetical protein
MPISFVITDFYFCFLVKVEFLTYLKLCKLPIEIDFIIVILEKLNKTCELEVHICNPFHLLKFICFFFICCRL